MFINTEFKISTNRGLHIIEAQEDRVIKVNMNLDCVTLIRDDQIYNGSARIRRIYHHIPDRQLIFTKNITYRYILSRYFYRFSLFDIRKIKEKLSSLGEDEDGIADYLKSFPLE